MTEYLFDRQPVMDPEEVAACGEWDCPVGCAECEAIFALLPGLVMFAVPIGAVLLVQTNRPLDVAEEAALTAYVDSLRV